MRSLFKRFDMDAELRLSERELSWRHPKKPSRIFVCSNLDLFHSDIPRVWVDRILNIVESHPQNVYQFLTKNPCMYSAYDFPENAWVGTTVDGLAMTGTNFMEMGTLETKASIKFISFEPLLAPQNHQFHSLASFIWTELDWIIIGADSRRGAQKPPIGWAKDLINKARDFGIKVWVKDNYGYPENIKELPNGNR